MSTFTIVKRWIVLLLAVMFFAGHYNLMQVSRLSLLTTHFIHHQQQHQHTFSDFFIEHYSGLDTDGHDQETDNTLPFKGYTPIPLLIACLNERTSDINAATYTRFLFPELSPSLIQLPSETPWQPPC